MAVKTLAQLKRDSKSGKIWMKCVEAQGRTGKDIPESMRNPRRLIDANSVDIFFLTPDGDTSACPARRANLIEYTDEGLTVYSFGFRDLTAEEKKVMDEWKTIENSEEYQESCRRDVLSDGSSSYWRKKWFFNDRNMPWLFTYDGISKYGKEYDEAKGKVKDLNVRGDVILRYVIVNASA